MRRITSARSTVLFAALALITVAEPTQARLRVQLHPAEAVSRSAAESSDGSLAFVSSSGVSLRLHLDPASLEFSNPARGAAFVPFAEHDVRQVLSQMVPAPGLELDVDVYLLPGLDPKYPSSFCIGTEIFLNPGLDVVPLEVVAYTVAHEIGHAVQHARVPRGSAASSPGWAEYRRLRNLSPTIHHDQAAHRDRPGEIFAEDFRVLFGGALANRSGSIENPDLPMPQSVPGLLEFFVRAFSFRPGQPAVLTSLSPNPFNPATTIRIELAARELVSSAALRVMVFDSRGRLVRDLGSVPPATAVDVPWNGRDDRGGVVASGRYTYAVTRAGQAVATGAMTLLK